MDSNPSFSHDTNFAQNKLINETGIQFMTVLIGSLARIEKRLGHLWGHELGPDAELTEEQAKYDDLYEELRKDILDHGHRVIRKMAHNVERYDIQIKGLKETHE